MEIGKLLLSLALFVGFIFHSRLLLCNVLADVDGDGENDNQTADDVLQVGVDAEEVQRVVDGLQKHSADDNALNGSDTAGEADAADNAGGDSVGFVVDTGVSAAGSDPGMLRQGY